MTLTKRIGNTKYLVSLGSVCTEDGPPASDNGLYLCSRNDPADSGPCPGHGDV